MCTGDVRNEEDLAEIVKSTTDKFGTLHVLVSTVYEGVDERTNTINPVTRRTAF